MIINSIPYLLKKEWVVSETWTANNDVVQPDGVYLTSSVDSLDLIMAKGNNSIQLTFEVSTDKGSPEYEAFKTFKELQKSIASSGISLLPNFLKFSTYWGISCFGLFLKYGAVTETYNRASVGKSYYTVTFEIQNFRDTFNLKNNSSASVSEAIDDVVEGTV